MTTIPFINFHTHHLRNAPSAIELYVQSLKDFKADHERYCLGLHPWDRSNITLESWIEKFEPYFKTTGCVAIGEVGIDLYKQPDLEYQQYMEYFFEQSKTLNKPLVLHIVKAYQELIHFLENKKITFPIIIHAFNGPEFFIKKYFSNPMYYSLGPRELARKNKEASYKKMLRERLLLETDDSQYSIEECYEMASEYFEVEMSDLKKNIFENFQKIFK